MKCLSFVLTMLALTPAPLPADTIVLAADPWCPFNCVPGSDKPGFLVDVARLAFARNHHTVIYKTLPWSRAIADARIGHFAGIIGASKREAADFIFPATPQMVAQHTLFTLTDSRWHYDNPSSLETIRLGAIDDYSYGSLAERYIELNRNRPDRLILLSGPHIIPRLIAMLNLRRIDAFIAERAVLYHTLSSARGSAVMLREAGQAGTESLYIAFSPALEQATQYARELEEGIDAMHKSGEWERLMADYGLKSPALQPTSDAL
ncbi:substrate-binding periplasmic protein [Marinobacter caseinilyticus]|uniref:substrate-binding periplasmic protein n=1 Tax=Marinobacter caseinilyticus TaxID=2692195 RepID=UPI00140B0EE4|nr:transporter substrate-binding domain-containing protein [Marinobacter caseinilyticus]